MREFEVFHSSIFDQTAEGRAKNQAVVWWVLFSSYWKEEEGSDFAPVFDGESFKTKLESYDEIEEKEDLFWQEAIRKFSYFVGFWYSGRATNEEEFKEIEKLYDSSQFEEGGKKEEEEEKPQEPENPQEPEEPKETEES